MDQATRTAEIAADAAAHLRKTSPRADLWQSVGWIVLGVATGVGSWNMDRLEKQDINPYTVPGLLPGFLGAALVFFGLLMLFRSLRRGALDAQPRVPSTPATRAETTRLWAVLGLCAAFAAGLVGHGPPFWLAAALFITVMISLLRYAERKAKNQVARGIAIAALTGLIAGIVIQLVFQEFFLVRLP